VGGTGITIGGIVGGIVCGYLSDKLFQSRRPPVAFIFYIGQVVLASSCSVSRPARWPRPS